MDNPEFTVLCNEYDILAFQETKTDSLDKDCINKFFDQIGFTVFYCNRNEFSSVRSGGLCTIVRKNLLKNVSMVQSESKIVLWCKINNMYVR